MKKIIFSLTVLLLLSNCVLLDSLGLNVVKETIQGSQAKNHILTGALIGAAASGSSTTIATSIATYNTKGLKDSKFYDKEDVDACADKVIVATNALSNNPITKGIAIGSVACAPIREHKTFVDWPLELF
ncbi:MAG: TIGR04452 family lipoprotein [Leptospiraceae bacterium]|nr:TIGR04452 family lipoprotein [Leptospiraceae bacterium]MBK7055884.1 TIGR04452 family lipoprotein [Leptospiraceae bacterium]MBK9500935.1 TIGR04452 family lipoprotein [Leptospiraceae bacterium]MBL0267090.1 TIGR04452 family lipoprotein [Leptospiraceae bacterium]MBP9163796.1 TIGR04452 family lipoprotein [Leptospiraceae bacterium]